MEDPAATPGDSFDKGKVNLVYMAEDGSEILFGKVSSVNDCADHQGWHYDDENSPSMVLACPAMCEAIRADINGRVVIGFGCASIPLE